MKNQNQEERDFVRKNEQIRCSKVLLVRDGQKLGTFPPYEALRMARDVDLDLVEIAPQAQPPVCAIMDYGKFRFDQQRKDKEKKKNSGPKEKEITFRYVISDHDLLVKANTAKRMIEEGDRVRIAVKFKARENAHKDQGMIVINKCLDLIKDFVTVERIPSFEGNQIICKVIPKVIEKGK